MAFLDHVELHLESSPINASEKRRKNDGRSNKKTKGNTTRGKPNQDQEMQNGVWLGSVHQSKGVEWNHVFVLHMNEGQFPLDQMSKSPTAINVNENVSNSSHMEAERRLAFVAASRARLQLTFTLAMVATGNRGVEFEPSRFLRAIPKRIVKNVLHMDRDFTQNNSQILPSVLFSRN